jgi:hypothetical protein
LTTEKILADSFSGLMGGSGREREPLKKLIIAFPFIFIILLFMAKFLSPHVIFPLLVKNDHKTPLGDTPLIYFKCVIYFTCSFLAFSIARNLGERGFKTHAALFYVLTVLTFWIGGEEVSWGQRIFGSSVIPTTEFFKRHNEQHETNLHNFLSHYYLHALYVVSGFYGAFSRLLVPRKFKVSHPEQVELLTPGPHLFPYFFACFFYYFYYDYLSIIDVAIFQKHSLFVRFFSEGLESQPMKFILSLGFLMFFIERKLRLSNEQAALAGKEETP